jgi:adenosylcobinamide kinase/adenosylcobinamide-phosphate guanylyltransferase
MTVSLIFGGARSGKSAYAEQLARQAEQQGKRIVYIATAARGDSEMQQRIAHHQQRRPEHWTTVEEPVSLAAALHSYGQAGHLILVDCLTVWLSNLLFAEAREFPETGQIDPPAVFSTERAALLAALQGSAADIVLVSNEVGMGIVPMGAVSRWFVDEAGRLNQAVAASADQVYWVAAGLPLKLKG